ncbi:acetylornithine deacetylase [Candidatus Woesearchaeota archaeon]|nr:acetylornithine deacetylase [Candidatus Woesearchaeota archaeon]
MSYKSAVKLTQKLVSVNSVSARGNMGIARLLIPYLEGLGFDVECHPRNHTNLNLIARLGGQDARYGGLAFVGHLDTVPYESEREKWGCHPLGGLIEDGKIWGVGTADMKGPIAAAIFAAKRYTKEVLRRPFVLYLTDGEEVGHTGAKWLLAHGLLDPKEVRHAIVGEPTSLVPVSTHLGIGETDVIVYGKGGHGSETHLGDNANERAAEVILGLKELRIALEGERHKTFEYLYPALNIGIMQGGTAKNKIPQEAVVKVQYRTFPGHEPGYVHNRVAGVVEEIAAKSGFEVKICHLRDDPGFETPADSELVRFLEELTGKRSSGVNFSTEATELQQAGIEPVVLGAGSIKTAHRPNEFVPLEELLQSEEMYAKAIRVFCK